MHHSAGEQLNVQILHIFRHDGCLLILDYYGKAKCTYNDVSS